MKIPQKNELEKCCGLLREAVRAHGGLEKWHSVQETVIRAKTGGIALPMRFQPSAFKSYKAHISTAEPRTVITPHPDGDHTGVFEGDTVKILDRNGEVLESRKDPRRKFQRLRRKFYWDDLDVLYFGGYALWNYLNLPFILASPDLEVRETSPWKEKGRTFRRLHAVFPDTVPTHCREQVFYFDENALLVRHDYTAEVFGPWAKAAHYTGNYRDCEGLRFPMHRRVFPRKRSGFPLRLVILVAIDIDEVKLIHRSSR